MLNVEYFLNKNPNWNLIMKGLMLSGFVFFGYMVYQVEFNNKPIFLEEESNNV